MNTQHNRELSATEIEILKQQGCTATDWTQILVDQAFVPENIRSVQFSGSVRIGDNSGTVEFNGGIIRNCGITMPAFTTAPLATTFIFIIFATTLPIMTSRTTLFSKTLNCVSSTEKLALAMESKFRPSTKPVAAE